MSEEQLEINLTPKIGNRLRNALENGRFITLIETQVPATEMDKTSAVKRIEALENAVFNTPYTDTGLAIVDNPGRPDWKAVELAAALPAANRDRHLVYLSGAGLDKAGVLELIQMAENAGVHNLVPVSGDIPEKSRDAKDCRQVNFTESCNILKMLSGRSEKFFAGTAVNPFQYTPYTLLASYYKLIKKFNCGAGFLVTQAGWDMLKLQSLAWYLTGRNMYYPKIARLMLLTPDRVESIISGKIPGVKISRGMQKTLEKELSYSKDQFERLELQAAGCRLLGFSGVQICGVDNPVKMRQILERINTALNEFTCFETWLDEYNAFMASSEMNQYSGDFQLYDRMLYRSYPYDEPPETRELPDHAVNILEKAVYGLKAFLFSHADRQRPENAGFLKTALAGCNGCRKCHLPQKNHLCTHTCPMELINGICGAVLPDGSCPVTGKECVHQKVLRFAHWKNKLPEQENIILSED